MEDVMFTRTLLKSGLMLATVTLLASGCLTDLMEPETQPSTEFSSFSDEAGLKTTAIGPIGGCTPSPDLVPNGRIDASDLALFAARERQQDLSADFTGNGVVDGFDRRVLEFFLGKPYTHDCARSFSVPKGCYIYATPDINGSGIIDASDLAAFTAARGLTAIADFNGDRVVNELDKIALEERLGQPYTARHYANPDLNGDGMVTASDLAVFATLHSLPSADFTHNGVVNDNDLKVIEYMLGRPYVASCEQSPLWTLAEDCLKYASPDLNGSGWVDASDLALFHSGALTVAQGDLNGDGVVDTLDEILLLDHLGEQYSMPRCSAL